MALHAMDGVGLQEEVFHVYDPTIRDHPRFGSYFCESRTQPFFCDGDRDAEKEFCRSVLWTLKPGT
jgi:hypothetical protein